MDSPTTRLKKSESFSARYLALERFEIGDFAFGLYI